MGVNHLSANGRNVSMGAKLKLATWNCGGLSYTQRELCAQLGYDILALTETHDSGQLRPSKRFLTGDIAPAEDKYAGVAMLLSDRAAGCVMYTGCRGPRIVFARIRASPCNLFVVCVYVPHSGRQCPSAADTLYELEDLLNSAPLHDCVIVLGTSMQSFLVAMANRRVGGAFTEEGTRRETCWEA